MIMIFLQRLQTCRVNPDKFPLCQRSKSSRIFLVNLTDIHGQIEKKRKKEEEKKKRKITPSFPWTRQSI